MKTVDCKNISLEAAKKAVETAEKKASELGVPMSVAIVDTGGRVVLHSTMDGTMPLAIDIALAKARTSAGTFMATMDFYEFAQQHQHLADTVTSFPGITLIGGGLPIMDKKVMVGAIGVSGGLYLQDIECAKAGLAAISSSQVS